MPTRANCLPSHLAVPPRPARGRPNHPHNPTKNNNATRTVTFCRSGEGQRSCQCTVTGKFLVPPTCARRPGRRRHGPSRHARLTVRQPCAASAIAGIIRACHPLLLLCIPPIALARGGWRCVWLAPECALDHQAPGDMQSLANPDALPASLQRGAAPHGAMHTHRRRRHAATPPPLLPRPTIIPPQPSSGHP